MGSAWGRFLPRPGEGINQTYTPTTGMKMVYACEVGPGGGAAVVRVSCGGIYGVQRRCGRRRWTLGIIADGSRRLISARRKPSVVGVGGNGGTPADRHDDGRGER